MNLEFRVIKIEKRNPYFIAAIDQAIFEGCKEGKSPPTLVYHNWEKAVSIAAGQLISDVNLEECERLGYQVIRMRSGGRAVVHQPDTEFSYSLFVPVEIIGTRDTRKINNLYCGRVAAALKEAGLEPEIRNLNDIYVSGKKLNGNAQHIGDKVALQHGIILYQIPDLSVMIRLMNSLLYDRETALQKLEKRITSVNEHSKISQEQLRDILTKTLLDGDKYKEGTFTKEELNRANELVENYKTFTLEKGHSARGLCWLPDDVKGGPPKGTFVGESPEWEDRLITHTV